MQIINKGQNNFLVFTLTEKVTLNNPYLLANGEERFATKGYVLLKYFNTLLISSINSFDFVE